MLKLRPAALALGAGLLALPALAQERLVINSYGGVYEENHRRLVIEPFEQLHGVTVEVVTLYSADALAQLRAQKDNPQFDVIHFSGGQEVVAAAEGLLVPILPEELSNYADLYPIAVAGIEEGRGPVYSISVAGLLYDETAIDPAPTSWNDLFTAADGELVTIADISNTYGLLTLLMLNQVRGGDLQNVQPGLDAVAELLERGAQIVTSSPELQTAFAQGSTNFAAYALDYAHTLRAAGMPVQFVQPEEGSPAFFITANVVAGRPNAALAKQFVDFSLRAEAQAGWAEAMRYSPTSKAVVLEGDMTAGMVYGQQAIDRIVRFDPVQVNANRAAWTDAWNRTIAR